MSMGDLNLAKELVWSARKRSVVYRLMLFYLLASSVLLPLLARRAVVKICDGASYHRQSRVIQKRFENEYPGQGAPPVCAEGLSETMKQNVKKAAAINQAAPSVTRSIVPVLELLLRQRENGQISQMLFTQENKNKKAEMDLSLIVPARSGGDSPAFLRNWRNDPQAVKQIATVVPVTTERGSIMDQDVLTMKYKLTFKDR